MEATLLKIVQTLNAYLSDYILIILLVGTGLFFTFKTKFVQVRCFGEGLKNVFGGIFKKKEKGSGISSFQALATAVAAQVGTGNIVGASGAILIGGPGAIFWMWIIAFLGMATIYAEAVLAQDTRVVDKDGNYKGGPVYYIKKAFPNGFGKFLSTFFAIAAVLALGFMGSMVQTNSIAESLSTAVGTDISLIVGIILAAISAFIFIGGIKRIASVTEKMVPIMAILFLVGGIVILCARIEYLPATIGAIFKYAFTPNALIGGTIGAALKTAISQGAKRGLFSNEAGMGSTPHAHAVADVKKPHDQGVAAMIGVFIDTFVVLTMTALIVISCLYVGDDGMLAGKTGEAYLLATQGTDAIAPLVTKTSAMQTAYTMIMPGNIGNVFVAICLFFFAFSTVISWNYFGKINAEYLCGGKKWGTILYAVISIAFIFMGTQLSNNLVWELTDFFNYLMVLPNAIALIALYKIVEKSARNK